MVATSLPQGRACQSLNLLIMIIMMTILSVSQQSSQSAASSQNPHQLKKLNLPAAKPQSPDPHADHLPLQPGDRENDDVDGDVDVGDVGVDGDDDEKELRVLPHSPTNILHRYICYI